VPNKFLIISEWQDIKAFQQFIVSEAFNKVTNWSLTEILLDKPTHKIY
jgi:hypothetical protein